MKKILIFNAFPTNNGDAALVFSLFESFKKKGYDVKIAAQKFTLIKSLYSSYPVVRELTDYKVFNKVPMSRYVKTLFTPIMFLFSKHFMRADVLVASPGGYMNSYYGFSRVAATLFVAKLFNKQTAIYSQSFGPLNKKDKFLLKFVSNFVDILYARDQFSFNVLKDLKIKESKYFLVEDGAFLIPFEGSNSKNDTIAISVRSWKHDLRNEEIYYSMIRAFVLKCVESNFKVEFLSTCQGLEGYVDDSKIASEIVSTLPSSVIDKVTVNSNYYTLHGLQQYIGKFRAVIGTRLHMCILSMLRGKPCLNISYEIKGKEAFDYLDLADFTVDYNEGMDSALPKLQVFLSSLDNLETKLKRIMPVQNEKANMYFDQFLQKL